MPRYIRTVGAIGDNSRSIIFDADNTGNVTTTIEGDVSKTTSTVVRINGERIDMTDAEVGERRRVDGYVLKRTATGLHVRDLRK